MPAHHTEPDIQVSRPQEDGLRAVYAPDPDFARFNAVMLYREPICVLVLCTDQTSKGLQTQQVVAATREIVCTGAVERTRTSSPQQFSEDPQGAT
jgi:hypothetical protein